MSNHQDDDASSITDLIPKPHKKNYEEAVGLLMTSYGLGFGGGAVSQTTPTPKKKKPKKVKKGKGKQSPIEATDARNSEHDTGASNDRGGTTPADSRASNTI